MASQLTRNSISNINYTGTKEQWNSITIGENNDYFTSATVNYNYTPPVASGDVNGDDLVTARDAQLVLSYSVDNIVPSKYQIAAGDMNGDGKLSTIDARIILVKVVENL